MRIRKNFFVSYARADGHLPNRLLELLRPRLAIMQGFDCDTWIDTMIPVGAAWRREIDTALAQCDFGLLLLSPGFFASRFISERELPRFLGLGPDGGIRIRKPIVPVGLKYVPLDGSADLKGLDQIQIFRDSQDRWFNQTRGQVSETFADQLVAAIVAKLGP
ncbi:toll/interleukin-1 receptor domain-containing protein [Candidatus Thiosymbion oneisti]|uniref:toll/interleukin-1 receptor domain-containing protein n=1 Tax=Candidatus Thiosymbion oneisti TaxID=589554 RepID=UPI000B7C98D2|nr:toll/interleukin-1 receptor domain-containing protein [Candidatus Thiosymbion oneisti]